MQEVRTTSWAATCSMTFLWHSVNKYTNTDQIAFQWGLAIMFLVKSDIKRVTEVLNVV